MAIHKDMALTPEKKKFLIGEVELEIENLNKAVREGGLPSGVLEAVKANRDSLQNILNKLFQKKGIVTPQETSSTISAIEKSKADRMQRDLKRNLNRILVFGGVLLVLWAGYKLYTKSKSSQ